MLEFFKSFSQSMSSRMKNPIFGAFIFSWLALNINGVAVFVLSSNEKRIDIASSKVWDFYGDDFLVPALLAMSYLFIMPLLHLAHDKFVNEKIVPERFKALRTKHASEITADKLYVREYEFNRISNLLKQRENLSIILSELRNVSIYFRGEATMASNDKVVKLEGAVEELSKTIDRMS